LRKRDVKMFKAHVAANPGQAGRLSQCLGLSDDLAEIELYKAISVRAGLKDLHPEARAWLRARGIEPPVLRVSRGKRKGSRRRRKHP
jgi:hypothetical protein